MAQRILLTQLRRVGDVLLTTPALAAVRRAYPDAHITYLTEAPSDQLFRHSPHVDKVMVASRDKGAVAWLRLIRKLRAGRYDLAVDFFSNPRSALLTRFCGAPRRIGHNLRGRAWCYTDAVELLGGANSGVYAPAAKVHLLAPLGITAGNLLPELYLGPQERAYAENTLADLGVGSRDLLVALSPVSRQPYKVWPAENFARLADVMIERYGARVLLCWGPGEERFANAVRLHMHHQALPDYPMPSLLELAALLERAHIYVGNDNGPRHFAVALGTPTVTVFGMPLPADWTPPGQPQHRTVDHDPGCKSHCRYPRCGLECINDVPYKAMEAETERLLEEILRDGTAY